MRSEAKSSRTSFRLKADEQNTRLSKISQPRSETRQHNKASHTFTNVSTKGDFHKPMQTRREKPGPGQESVWDYPRPPRLENCTRRVRVIVGGVTIADSTRTRRVLETSHPPVYYIPPEDVDVECFVDSPDRSWCEWKGEARYYSVVVPGKAIDKAAWYYPNPRSRFAEIEGYVAFYPSKMDACYIDEERVQAQEGDFYGGWITSNIVGPFKGAPGTLGW